MAIIIVAPRNAPMMIAINPFMVSMSVVMLPFSSSITIATPKLAPLFIPKMDGPARGLLNAVCNISPHTANDAPQSVAVAACGSLDSIIIYRQVAFSPSSPCRMFITESSGIWIAPVAMFAMNNTVIRASMATIYISVLLFVRHLSLSILS